MRPTGENICRLHCSQGCKIRGIADNRMKYGYRSQVCVHVSARLHRNYLRERHRRPATYQCLTTVHRQPASEQNTTVSRIRSLFVRPYLTS